MSERDFFKKSFRMSFGGGIDEFRVSKIAGSDWTDVECVINGGVKIDTITVRDRHDLSMLHHALGMLLNETD